MRRSSTPSPAKSTKSFALWGLELWWLPTVTTVQRLSSIVLWTALAACALLVKVVQLVYAPGADTEPVEGTGAAEEDPLGEAGIAEHWNVTHVIWYVGQVRTRPKEKLLKSIMWFHPEAFNRADLLECAVLVSALTPRVTLWW